MPRIAKHTKAEMAERLSRVFEENGYEGASTAMLAKAAGLSKASLYHHFPNGKKDMATSVLAYAGARLQKYVLKPLSQNISGEEKLKQSYAGVLRYYSGEVLHCLMNSLLLGEGKNLFQKEIANAVAGWAKSLETAYEEFGLGKDEARTKATDAITAIQGSLIICRVEGSRRALTKCLLQLQQSLSLLD